MSVCRCRRSTFSRLVCKKLLPRLDRAGIDALDRRVVEHETTEFDFFAAFFDFAFSYAACRQVDDDRHGSLQNRNRLERFFFAFTLCDSISAFCVGLGASSVPQNPNSPNFTGSVDSAPHPCRQAPLPASALQVFDFGVPLRTPCSPSHASGSLLRFLRFVELYGPFHEDRGLERRAIAFDVGPPEHCSPRSDAALAVAGAATATTAAAETVHARTRRRREKDVITLTTSC